LDEERHEIMAYEIQADYASGSALYAILRNPAAQVWHPARRIFEEWGASGHAIADYGIPLIDRSGSRHVGDFDTSIPGGSYCIQVFCRAGASPADTDLLVCSREILWTGAGELTAVKMLVNRAVQDTITREIDYYDDDGQTVLLTLTPRDDDDTCSLTPQS
jgi:hypothetical protein